jgi:hypothetical protein
MGKQLFVGRIGLGGGVAPSSVRFGLDDSTLLERATPFIYYAKGHLRESAIRNPQLGCGRSPRQVLCVKQDIRVRT